MPLPLVKVLAQKPPKGLPDDKGNGAYDERGQAIYVRKAEDCHPARVTGPLAAQAAPEQRVKTLVAASESLAMRAAERWVAAQHDGQEECERELDGARN
jgi:hypothetical protein